MLHGRKTTPNPPLGVFLPLLAPLSFLLYLFFLYLHFEKHHLNDSRPVRMLPVSRTLLVCGNSIMVALYK